MLSPELDPEKLTRMAERHPGFLHDFSFYSLVDNQDARHRDIARASGLCSIRNMQKIWMNNKWFIHFPNDIILSWFFIWLVKQQRRDRALQVRLQSLESIIYHEIIISLPRDLVILHDSLLVLGQALNLWRQNKAFLGNTRVSCQEEQVGHYCVLMLKSKTQ